MLRRRRGATRRRSIACASSSSIRKRPDSIHGPTAWSPLAPSRFDGEILFEDSFDALLKVEREYLGGDRSRRYARREPRASRSRRRWSRFLDYLGDGVIVGHHIGHDIATFDAAYEALGRRAAQSQPRHDGPDPASRTRGAFAGRPPIRRFTLDASASMFGVIPHDRHTASGDAFITAQVFLRLLRLAARTGRAPWPGWPKRSRSASHCQINEPLPPGTRAEIIRHCSNPDTMWSIRSSKGVRRAL